MGGGVAAANLEVAAERVEVMDSTAPMRGTMSASGVVLAPWLVRASAALSTAVARARVAAERLLMAAESSVVFIMSTTVKRSTAKASTKKPMARGFMIGEG